LKNESYFSAIEPEFPRHNQLETDDF
jgi:hypothetical protein